MNLNIVTLKSKLLPIFSWVRNHAVILSIVGILLLYGGLVVQINLLNRREPSEDAVNEKLQTLKRPKIDDKVIEKMEQLEDNSEEVNALFKQARDNPFQE